MRSAADPTQIYAVCLTSSQGGRILLVRSKEPPSVRVVVGTLGLDFRPERGDTIMIDLLSRHEIAHAPLITPGSGIQLTSTGAIAA